MNFSQITIFLAVAETGSVSKAARQLNRVPSNITTRIKQLEDDLGLSLFIRENNRLRLSPAGHTLQQYGIRILGLVQEARDAITGEVTQGHFPLGALESAAAVRIPDLLARFNQEYSRVQLDLTTGSSGSLIDKVMEGTLSAAFVDGPVLHPVIDGISVFEEEMVIIAPKTQRLFSRPADIDGCNIYAFRTDCSYRRHFESWFSADGAQPGKIYEMESYHGMLACVVAGAGFAMLPRSMLSSMPGHERVDVFTPEDKWRWLTTWLVWRRGVITPQLEAFIGLLPAR